MPAPSWARLLVGAATLTALLALAARAHAWTLRYDVPAGCDATDTFRARAESQRVRTGELADVPVAVRAWQAPHGQAWHVRVEFQRAGATPGVRELDGRSCAEVTDAAALIVAYSLDGALEAATRPAPTPVLAPRPLPRPARDPLPDDALRARAPSDPVWLTLALAAGVDTGTLPTAGPGGRAEVSIGWLRGSLVLGLVGWVPVRQRYQDGLGIRARAWQGHVGARFRIWRRLELGAGFEIGQLDAVAENVSRPIPRTVAWQGAGGSLLWHLPLWRDLEFSLEIDAFIPFIRPSLVVDGQLRHRPELCLRLWSGLAWRFR